jgi:hypothetical protein
MCLSGPAKRIPIGDGLQPLRRDYEDDEKDGVAIPHITMLECLHGSTPDLFSVVHLYLVIGTVCDDSRRSNPDVGNLRHPVVVYFALGHSSLLRS